MTIDLGAREISQWLIALAALLEDLSSSPENYVRRVSATRISGSKKSSVFFWPADASPHICHGVDIVAYMQTNKNKSWRKRFPEGEKVEEAKRVIIDSMVDAGSTQSRETEESGSLAIAPHDRDKEVCLSIPSYYIWGDKDQAEPRGACQFIVSRDRAEGLPGLLLKQQAWPYR